MHTNHDQTFQNICAVVFKWAEKHLFIFIILHDVYLIITGTKYFKRK